MDCGLISAHKFRTRLGLEQYDVVLTKEESVLTKIMSSFERANVQTQYNVLGYIIDLYFHNCKLAIEQELGCKFIRIDPDKEDFEVF